MGQKRARKTSVKKGPRKEPGKGRKRQKTTHKEIPLNIAEAHNQMKRGILERIADVPVDILCEILLHLSPKDLLSLTKASRDLKALLMDDTYIFIWRHARTVHEPELPPLPRGFTEYEYANLVFDTHCHECKKPLSKNVLWAAKVRLCGICFEDKTITSFATPPRWLDPILMDVSCHVNPKYRRNARASIWRDDSSSISADTPHVWYLNGADELMAQLEELKLTGDDAKIQEWLREKKSEAEDGIQLCKALNTFTISMQNRRYDELQSLRQERQRSVLERLNAAGWEEELAHGSVIREIQFNELVDQPKVLTDKAWKDIEPRLTSHLKKIRAQIKMKSDGDVLDARLALFSERYDRLVGPLPFLPPFPPRNDVLRYAPFKSTIFETPLNQGTLKDRLELDFQLHWDSICAKWRRIHEGALKSMLVESGQSDDLNLAMNAFECDDCSALVNYPDVLVHHCYRSHIEACDSADFGRSSSLKLFYNVPNYWTRWHLERIIIACGLDPMSATTREMDKLDVFLYCIPCSKVDRYHDPHALVPRRPNQLIVAMRWNDAAAIPHPAHDQSSSPSWEILSDRGLLRAVRAEDLRHRFGGLEGSEDQNIMCLHCDDEQRYVQDEMREHLQTAHDIAISLDQAVTSHYRPHVASKCYRQPTCYIVQSCDKGGFEVTVSHRS